MRSLDAGQGYRLPCSSLCNMLLPNTRKVEKYHYWANERVLQTAEQGPADLLDEAGRRSSTRIRDILVHTVGAEWVWCSRWQGVSPTQCPTTADLPTLAAVRERWYDQERQVRAVITSLQEDDLATGLTYSTTLTGESTTMPLGHTMLQVVNHGTQHRSEVALLLTELGHSPGDLDLHVFLLEQTSRS